VPRRREAQRAFFHCLRHEPIHLLLLGGMGRPLVKAHYHALYLLRRYTGGNVDRYAVFHHAVKISRECLPIGFDAVAPPMLETVFFQHCAFQRRHGLAFADNIQRHPLPHLAFGITVGNQRLVAVGMHVDVAG